MAHSAGFPLARFNRMRDKILGLGKDLAVIRQTGDGPSIKHRQVHSLYRIV